MDFNNAYALSVRGTSHVKSGALCQDASTVQYIDSDTIIIAVADGLGSKILSAVGSEVSIRFACRAYKNNLFSTPQEILLAAQRHLQKFAKKIGLSDPNDLATTLQLAIISEHSASFVICGDGGIVYSAEGEHFLITDGQTYELANLTHHLLSENLESKINTLVVDKTVSHVSLFSDGMREVLINEKFKSAHEPIWNHFVKHSKVNGVENAVHQLVTGAQAKETVDDDLSLASYVMS